MKMVCIDRVVCINNIAGVGLRSYKLNVTVDKWYDVIEYDDDGRFSSTCWIINDSGEKARYTKKYFKTLSELREEKLNIIFE
jgi:hypothetical protein